jgi:hypothetical protein
MMFWGSWAPQNGPKKHAKARYWNGPKKVLRGPQVGRVYVTILKLENRPLTISVGPFFKKKWSGVTRK